MIKIGSSSIIVIINTARNKEMSFHLKVFDFSGADKILKQAISDPSREVFVDCDEDAFIIKQESLIQIDELLLIWQRDKKAFSKEDSELIRSNAPSLFPIFTLDIQNEPLMLAWGKPDSLFQSEVSGLGTYYSRSRNNKWTKGEDSGHLQHLQMIYLSMDPFYAIYHTDQIGAACHTGYYSCFFRKILSDRQIELIHEKKVEGIK